MVKLKTNREKAIAREKKRNEEYKKIGSRFNELISKGMSKSDAVTACANEFDCSLPKIYTARKYYDKYTSTD